MNKAVLLSLGFFISLVFGSGGYDNGTAAGKGNLDISLTWNPFNYFEKGQSYVIFGYGLSNRFDFHGYFSHSKKGNYNYYSGLLYQFYHSKRFSLSTAIGLRKYNNKNTTHLFFPQILYSARILKKAQIGGSVVNIRSQDLKTSIGKAIDIFFMTKIFENNNYKVSLSIGAFNPVLWEPDSGDWYPTYSLDIKIKK